MIKEYYADGSDKQSYFTQLNPHTSPNNTGYYSGCGATAWMNLFGWHSLNFTPALLNGQHRENDDYINSLTMELHNNLNTVGIPFSDQGLTLPWFMYRGDDFAKKFLSHAANGYKYRTRSFVGSILGYRDGNWVFEVAKEFIINKKRPVIVGYFKDWHYAIGYGIIETIAENGMDFTCLLKINRGWGSEVDPDNDAVISPKDIFACYGVEGFSPLLK